MADHQRIHHVVANMAPPAPTQPLVPRGSLTSDKADPRQNQIPPPRHMSLPMPLAPKPPPPKPRTCRWCKCLCWTLSLIILLLIAFAASAGIIYLVFKPKIPNYSVDDLTISDLSLNFDLSLYARFDVRITAVNPNEKIGIYYERGSRISVWYKDTNLCQGSIPAFYQGHENKTVLDVALSGQNQYGRTLLDALQEQQQTGRIPLDLKIDEPVRLKLGRLKLIKVRVLGTCQLIVDSLSTNSLVNIKASTCSFGLKL